MLLGELVETWDRVRSTRSRLAKIEELAMRLGRLEGTEIEIGSAFLAGEPRQGKLGVGYRTLHELDVQPAPTPSLSLTDVDDSFEELTRVAGPGSRKRRDKLLVALFERATQLEASFLRGLILRELRQGALEGIMVEAVADAAEVSASAVRRALMLSGDLAGVAASVLRDGAAALDRFRLTLFTPLRPMLAETAASVQEAMAKVGKASVEVKYDGARIQVHKQDDRVRVYTRNLRDVTASIEEVAELALGLPAHSLILDGEAMTFRADGRPGSFEETISQFSQEAPTGGVVAFFFDCLHLDGRDLIDLPALDRFEALRSAVPPESVVPRVITAEPKEAESFYEGAVDHGHEGIMVKAIDAPYEAGKRGASWLKVKPAHTLDLVVLAAEWGSGRRRGWLSNLHLGARDLRTGDFVMLGKTFKGLTDEMLEWQTQRFLELERDRNDWAVFLKPEQVVEVAFDGVQGSPRYPGGVALRFARVKRYRDDKSADEADTIDTVRAIWKGGR